VGRGRLECGGIRYRPCCSRRGGTGGHSDQASGLLLESEVKRGVLEAGSQRCVVLATRFVIGVGTLAATRVFAVQALVEQVVHAKTDVGGLGDLVSAAQTEDGIRTAFTQTIAFHFRVVGQIV